MLIFAFTLIKFKLQGFPLWGAARHWGLCQLIQWDGCQDAQPRLGGQGLWICWGSPTCCNRGGFCEEVLLPALFCG